MKMLADGLCVTIGTDDPSISQITLTDEYQRACDELDMPQQVLKQRILVAAQAGFLPEAERDKLVNELRKELMN